MKDWRPSELVQKVFGRDKLITACPQAVNQLYIPEQSKKFLLEVGMPSERILLCSFDLNVEKFPTIAEYARNKGEVLKGGEFLKRIGTDDGMQLCLTENQKSGNLLAFDISEQFPTRFVNTNIETFAAFLALYVDRYAKICSEAADDELDAAAIDLEKYMQTIDPPSFSNPECWWAMILEQMKDGLL